MPKLKLSNGQTLDVAQEVIDAAYLAAHPTTPPPTTPPGTQVDPNIVALRDIVQSMSQQLADERKDRATEKAQGAVDALIAKGKIKPAQRDKFVNLYLSDRDTFAEVSATLMAAPPATRVRNSGDPDDQQPGEFGHGEGGEEGDFSGSDDLEPGESQGGRQRNTGAIAEWDQKIAQIAKDETKGDIREAANVLQLREPNLYHKRREAYAGQRLPRIVSRNRHII
jgi:hypothetical protein